MRQMTWRGGVAVLAALTATLASAPASADEREQCASAADQAQQLRDEGKYRKARDQMLICARDVCPGPIKQDCGKWLSDIERDAPTVVLGAKNNGQDVTDVKVSIDGIVVTEKLDGKPMLVDAGEHTFRFEYQGAVKEEKNLLRAAEKGRAVVVQFGATAPAAGTGPGPAPAAPQEEGSIVPALVVGGVGLVALGSFAVFGIGGKNDVDDLQKCKPRCAEEDVDKARTKLIIADISLGVGIVALGVATYMFLTRPKIDAKVQTGKASTNPLHNIRVDFGPLHGGAAAGLGGTF